MGLGIRRRRVAHYYANLLFPARVQSLLALSLIFAWVLRISIFSLVLAGSAKFVSSLEGRGKGEQGAWYIPDYGALRRMRRVFGDRTCVDSRPCDINQSLAIGAGKSVRTRGPVDSLRGDTPLSLPSSQTDP